MTERLAHQLIPGDLVDLEGDKYADPNGDDTLMEFEYAVVERVERETPECVVVHTDQSSFGCPPDHVVKLAPPDCQPIRRILDIGHGEYVSGLTPLDTETIWNGHEDAESLSSTLEPTREQVENLLRSRGLGSDDSIGIAAEAEADGWWCIYVTAAGTPAQWALAAAAQTAEISVPPSGDDDTFDYWPSGVRLARAIAGVVGPDAIAELRTTVSAVLDAKDVLRDDGFDLDTFDLSPTEQED